MNTVMDFIKKQVMQNMNPKNIIGNMIPSSNNPIVNNLIQMGNNNDVDGIKKFAENIFRQQGRDFNKEFEQFKSNFK